MRHPWRRGQNEIRPPHSNWPATESPRAAPARTTAPMEVAAINFRLSVRKPSVGRASRAPDRRGRACAPARTDPLRRRRPGSAAIYLSGYSVRAAIRPASQPEPADPPKSTSVSAQVEGSGTASIGLAVTVTVVRAQPPENINHPIAHAPAGADGTAQRACPRSLWTPRTNLPRHYRRPYLFSAASTLTEARPSTVMPWRLSKSAIAARLLVPMSPSGAPPTS